MIFLYGKSRYLPAVLCVCRPAHPVRPVRPVVRDGDGGQVGRGAGDEVEEEGAAAHVHAWAQRSIVCLYEYFEGTSGFQIVVVAAAAAAVVVVAAAMVFATNDVFVVVPDVAAVVINDVYEELFP